MTNHVSSPPDDSLRRLRTLERQFLRPYRTTMILALTGMLVQSLIVLPVPLLQGWVLDRLIAAEPGAALIRTILVALAVMVLCYLARLGLALRVATVMSRVSLEVVRALTDAMHRKIQRQPVAYFDREPTGSLMARVTSDVGSLLIFLNGALLQLASDLVVAGGIAVTLFVLHWQLALVGLFTVPLFAANHRLFAIRVRRASAGARQQVTAMYSLLSERLSAVRVVRSFAREHTEIAELDAHLDAHRSFGQCALRAGAWQSSLALLIGGMGTVGVFGYGALLVQSGAITVGMLLACYSLLGLLYSPVVRLAHLQGILSATAVAVERIAEVLDEPEPQADRPGAEAVPAPRGAVSFRNVSFRYKPGGPLALDAVALEVEAGTTVGIVGASGAGKSTLLSLVPRIYEVGEGRGAVLLDGRDVRELKLKDLRRAAVLVPQQALLFEGTVRSNLIYAAPNASSADIRRALEIADFAATVETFPRGLDTPVGERGYSLSGGQRQRLALARALLADPAVLLLDDCTSALDAETEDRVHTALASFLRGRTCLLVSHKIAAVWGLHRIIVLNGGRIVEQGTHAELVARGGYYAEMCSLQIRRLAV